jgi:hypothetical protein
MFKVCNCCDESFPEGEMHYAGATDTWRCEGCTDWDDGDCDDGERVPEWSGFDSGEMDDNAE